MGGWSELLALPFIEFARLPQEGAVLDVGCGTGNLIAALLRHLSDRRVVGVDPSADLLEQARKRFPAKVALGAGMAGSLPFADRSFASCLSLLVLQEFHGADEPLRDMRRVTMPGGVVAACQWDFPRMPVIASLVDAISAVDASAAETLSIRSAKHFNDEAELARAWTRIGLREVEASRIIVTRRYSGFSELWAGLLRGSTPSTRRLATLPPDKQRHVQAAMISALAAPSSEAFALSAAALVVRGVV